MTVYSTTKLLRLVGALSAALPFALGTLPVTAQDDRERVGAVAYYSDRHDPYGTSYRTPYTTEMLSDLRTLDYRRMR
ncbi:MAG: hypothetical protein RLO50_14625 [Azospirillaceae bacterium]